MRSDVSSGLTRYDPSDDSWVSFASPNELPDDVIQAIVESQDGRIWIGPEGGLACYNPQDDTWTTYTSDDGLIDNDIYAICEDKQGRLWLGAYQAGLTAA